MLDHVIRFDPFREQATCLVKRQSFEPDLVEPIVREGARAVAAHAGDQRDAADVQPARNRCEKLRRFGIERVRVVEHDQHGALARGGREHAERGGEHAESLLRLRHRQAERTSQGVRLHRGDGGEPLEYGGEQLMQARIGEPGLCRHAAGREHRPAVGIVCDHGEQRALADPGLASDHKRPAAPAASVREQLVDAAALGDASHEHRTRS